MNERHSSKCPCGLKKLYSECCGQYHSGQAAPTAEALMRSRYSAYTLNNVDYIIDTTWPCQQVALKKDRAVLEANNTSWVRLDIVKTEAGNPSDHQGKVEFIAWYTEPPASTEKALHEISDFVKEGNRWFLYSSRAGKITCYQKQYDWSQ